MEELIEAVYNDLSAELSADGAVNETLLRSKVDGAVREVKRARKYPSSYTDDMILSDIEDFYVNIKNIARYDYNQIGIEGQISSSENGESRTYVDRNSLFYGIIPFAQ